MNISSPSHNFVNLYSRSAPPATAGRLPATVLKETDNRDNRIDGHSGGRTNRLTQALNAALREIGIGGAGSSPNPAGTPASTDATDAGAASAATPSTQVDVNAAVEQFANALMDALSAGHGARGHSGEHRQDGEHGHHGHGSRTTGYGDFAQRLESLSQTIVQTPPTADVPLAPASAVVPAADAPISLPPTVESDVGEAAPAPAPAVPAPVPAPAPTGSAPSKLLDAFSKLFDALKPPATADAPATDMATRLQQFLHTMAQTLSHASLAGAATRQTGAFVDVTA